MTTPRKITLSNAVTISNENPIVIMAGPCVLESRDHAFKMAETLCKMMDERKVGFIYKTSFDKANRTSIHGYRGKGLDECLTIFSELKQAFGMPIMTDVHQPDQCQDVAAVVDVLQIPAFLCRQTDLLLAAGETGKPLNVKKGQFLAPWDVPNIVAKIDQTNNKQTMLCERGASFGYNTLVNDMRALPIMAQTGCPVIFDATHSVQQPGGAGASTSGDRRFVPVLARAAVAVGVAGVFLETHEDPDRAPSDGPNMIPLAHMPDLIDQLLALDKIAKTHLIRL